MPRRKVIKQKVSPKKPNMMPKKIQPVSKAIRSYVNRAIGAHSENKTPTGVSSVAFTLNSMSSTSWGTIINCSQVWNGLVQGTGQGNRVGCAVRPIYWNLKGYLNNNGSTSTNTMIKMYIIKAKQGFQDPTVYTPTQPTDFYQLGNSVVAPTNTFLDLMRHVNNDKWTVYATRTFKVGAATSASGSNNDFKSVCAFNINLLKFQKHVIKYSDTGATTNSGLYAVFAIIDPLGGSTITPNGPELTYDVEAKFEDS